MASFESAERVGTLGTQTPMAASTSREVARTDGRRNRWPRPPNWKPPRFVAG